MKWCEMLSGRKRKCEREEEGTSLGPTLAQRWAKSFARVKRPPGLRKVTSNKRRFCTFPSQTTDTSLGEAGDRKLLSSRQPVTVRASAAASDRYASYAKDALQHPAIVALFSVTKTGI